MLMHMYSVAMNSNGKINSNGVGLRAPKCKVRNSTICFLWNSIHRLLSWKGNMCFKKSFEEKLYKRVGMAWCIHSLLEELPEEGDHSVTLAETAMPSPNSLMFKTSREQREIRLKLILPLSGIILRLLRYTLHMRD